MIALATPSQLKCLKSISLNVSNNKIPLKHDQLNRLTRGGYKNHIKLIAQTPDLDRVRKVLLHHGGFLPHIIPAALRHLDKYLDASPKKKQTMHFDANTNSKIKKQLFLKDCDTGSESSGHSSNNCSNSSANNSSGTDSEAESVDSKETSISQNSDFLENKSVDHDSSEKHSGDDDADDDDADDDDNDKSVSGNESVDDNGANSDTENSATNSEASDDSQTIELDKNSNNRLSDNDGAISDTLLTGTTEEVKQPSHIKRYMKRQQFLKLLHSDVMKQALARAITAYKSRYSPY